MPAPRTFTIAERRARLGVRHHLARPAASVEDATAALVGLHSSDPTSVYLSAWARVRRFEPAAMETALYDRKSLVRWLGMRRTLFVVARDLVPVVAAAATRGLVPRERKRLLGLLEDQGIARDPGPWLDDVRLRTLAALEDGEAAATDLTKRVPQLAHRLSIGEGKTWGGSVGVSTRVLFLLATEGEIVRARPRGSWTSGQYRWALTERWLGEPLASLDEDDARDALLDAWLRRFGPATTEDIRWWTGWTAKNATATLARIGAVPCRIEDEGDGWVAPGDQAKTRAPGPWVALLPGLDPTVMGWKRRAWYLAEHGPALFDRNGNAGPTVWADGRVIGGWAQRKDGDIAVELLERVPRAVSARVEQEAERLRAWFGETRVVARFRGPLERRLAG